MSRGTLLYRIEENADGQYTIWAVGLDKAERILQDGLETREQANQELAHQYAKDFQEHQRG